MVIFISLGSPTNLLAQKVTIEFLETYPNSVITSQLEPGDSFFRLVDLNRQDEHSALVGYCDEQKKDELWNYVKGTAFRQKLPGELIFLPGTESTEQEAADLKNRLSPTR